MSISHQPAPLHNSKLITAGKKKPLCASKPLYIFRKNLNLCKYILMCSVSRDSLNKKHRSILRFPGFYPPSLLTRCTLRIKNCFSTSLPSFLHCSLFIASLNTLPDIRLTLSYTYNIFSNFPTVSYSRPLCKMHSVCFLSTHFFCTLPPH